MPGDPIPVVPSREIHFREDARMQQVRGGRRGFVSALPRFIIVLQAVFFLCVAARVRAVQDERIMHCLPPRVDMPFASPVPSDAFPRRNGRKPLSCMHPLQVEASFPSSCFFPARSRSTMYGGGSWGFNYLGTY